MSQDEREAVELLPCPFCGSKEIATAWVRPTDECQWWGVCCMDCKAEISSVTHDRAVEAWNRRFERGFTVLERKEPEFFDDYGDAP